MAYFVNTKDGEFDRWEIEDIWDEFAEDYNVDDDADIEDLLELINNDAESRYHFDIFE